MHTRTSSIQPDTPPRTLAPRPLPIGAPGPHFGIASSRRSASSRAGLVATCLLLALGLAACSDDAEGGYGALPPAEEDDDAV